LQPTIGQLTKSTLHRCLLRHGLSHLSNVQDKTRERAFKKYPIGGFHIDIAEVHTKEGKRYLFAAIDLVAIDRTSTFAYAELHERQIRRIATEVLRNLIDVVPYHLHTVPTMGAIQFTHRQTDRHAFVHLFDRVCYAQDVDYRLTKPNHPWTNRRDPIG